MNQRYLVASTKGLAEDIQVCIRADAENIAAFIAKYPFAPQITMETLDGYFLLNTSLGFIFKCYDQTYLATQLIPVLAPMQMGERDIPEVVAFSDYSELTEEAVPPLPDWNAWRDYGISDEAFPAFREDLIKMKNEDTEPDSEEISDIRRPIK
jgi:hypothetical protein